MAGMLSRTATAVDVAKSQETKRYASNELAAAEERLMRARGAAQAKEYELADRLIAETLVNINLASAKAAAARAREQVDQIKVSPDDASKSGQR
jgi:DNA mismatch repair ATPase MutS